MALDLAYSIGDTVGGLLSSHGPAAAPACSCSCVVTTVMASPLFELVYGRNARETGELGALEGELAADAA